METSPKLAIFAVAPPGLEQTLAAEALASGFHNPRAVAGGVELSGGWPHVWRANLMLRGASRVLVRVGDLRATQLARLEMLVRQLPWEMFLPRGSAVRVEASCRRSKIYHSGAVVQRVEAALRDGHAMRIDREDGLRVMARFDRDVCTLSLDTSGDLLHRRGFRQATGKAPLRETLAALFLRECGYDGQEPLLDPMCGAGTFVIEAAEVAARLAPGRERSFAFEGLVDFDPVAWAAMREGLERREPLHCCYGYDRDAGAIAASRENAARAGVDSGTLFEIGKIGALVPPCAAPGLVIVNPPYGGRIGDARSLRSLYATLGARLREGFHGWRVGLVTSEDALARATALPFDAPGPPVPHGGLRIRLYRTPRL